MSRAALIARDQIIDHAALRKAPAPVDRRPLVLRGAPRLDRALAIHAALTHRRPIAPLPEDAPTGAEADHAARLAALPPSDEPPLAYLQTSGSTGAPKLVELGHDAWAAHARAAIDHLELREDDRWLCTLPLCHTGGLSVLIRCREAGAAVVLDDPPPWGARWTRWLAEHCADRRVTRLSLVPAQLALIVAADLPAPSALRSVLLGGQALSEVVADRALALGWPIVRSYGLTETCGMCVATRPGERPILAESGRPLAGVRLRLSDPQGDAGLLEIETRARATRVHGVDAFTHDGWLRTADRARLDGDRLTILGRADDVVISGGHKIDPLEVEAALRRLPFVADVAVAGVADASFGASLGALIVLQGDVSEGTAREAIAASMPAMLPRHQHPRHIAFVPALALLPSGKTDRRAISALLTAAR